jgi:hypothetical protein
VVGVLGDGAGGYVVVEVGGLGGKVVRDCGKGESSF